MCSISGGMFPTRAGKNSTLQKAFIESVADLICKAQDRGRDSFGVVCLCDDGAAYFSKYIGAPKDHPEFIDEMHNIPGPGISVIINNNRAEPTTEYVKEKKLSDVQPFMCGKWIVAHNGTIANDKELIQQFGLEVESSIDSAVLPALFHHLLGDEFSGKAVAEILKKYIVGSYALAIAHIDYPQELILATNYKPLYVARNIHTGVVYFSSLKEYLQPLSLFGRLHSHRQVHQVEPYSLLHLTLVEDDLAVDEFSLKKSEGNKRALVVCSGGLDSTVTATLATKKLGYDVTLLHFKYKCRAEAREVEAIRKIADRLGCDYLYVETDLFKSVIGGSRLTGTRDEIAEGEAGAEFAHEWVPARNLIMLALATGIAESKGYDVIMLGNNLEEAGAYPDNEMEFINKFNDILPFATQVDRHVRIEMPVGNLMKHEIVKLGLEIGAPLDITWSCYEGGELPCGKCGPCFMRTTAFKMHGVIDPQQYANPFPEGFWEGCVPWNTGTETK